MQLSDNGHPRRMRLDLYTPAEKAIRDAVGAVEEAGAHSLLTDAVNLLQQAREKVADFVELPGNEVCHVPQLTKQAGSTSVDQEWRRSLVVGWKKVENGIRKECWLRWTSPDGLYFWLHPIEGRWVGEPDQRTMPTFASYEKAMESYYHVEKPREVDRRGGVGIYS